MKKRQQWDINVLLRFETVTTDKLRVNFTDARACLCINNVEAYYAGETADVSFDNTVADIKELSFYISRRR